MNKQELNRFIDKISPTGPGGIEKIKKVLKLVLDRESEGKEGEEDITETSYSDLKTLRDNGQLIPGRLYRITDYVTTTVQEGTRSAGHQFDIIVQAITENTLSEDARAIQHKFVIPESTFSTSDDGTATLQGIEEIEGIKCYVYRYGDFYYAINIDNLQYVQDNPRDDFRYFFLAIYCKYQDEPWYENDDFGTLLGFTQDIREFTYFSNSNLAAWKLKYCLDNDADRFAWAANEHPKQVVVKDENNNPVYYNYWYTADTDNWGKMEIYSHALSGQEINDLQLPSYVGLTIQLSADEIRSEEDIDECYWVQYIGQKEVDESTVILLEEEWDFIKAEYNGKGVIYQMIDEHNNNCPYDFKNIQINVKSLIENSSYDAWCEEVGMFPYNSNLCYTFSDDNRNDTSLFSNEVYNNIIEKRNVTNKQQINNIVIVGTTIYGNKFFCNCNRIFIGDNCTENVFVTACYDLTIGNYFKRNVCRGFTNSFVKHVGITDCEIRNLELITIESADSPDYYYITESLIYFGQSSEINFSVDENYNEYIIYVNNTDDILIKRLHEAFSAS